jgi:hypothetical protein
MDTIGEDRSWNIIGQIKQFGKTIFRDFYKQERNRLEKVSNDKDFFDRYQRQLRQKRDEASQRMHTIADTFFDTISAEGLTTDDFARKRSGVCSIFLKIKEGKDFSEDFHTFTTDWEPGKITWYIDGNKYYETDDWFASFDGATDEEYPAPFNHDFYMILNLAVGGSWVGYPNDDTSFDNNPYVVDYVRVWQKDHYDENVKKPEKQIVLREPDTEGNYIHNGSFAEAEDLEEADDWQFLLAQEGKGAAEIADGEILIKTENEGKVDYSVQLVQAGVPFEKGDCYKVTFDAYASAPRTMKTAVKAPDNGWVEYMPAKTVELTTQKQTYSYAFKMKMKTDANGRLEFNMGAAGSAEDIHISNVSVKKCDPAEIISDSKVPYNKNLLKNTDFSAADPMENWEETITDGGEANRSIRDGKISYDITNLGTKDWHIQLKQTGLILESGEKYKVSFRASSTVERLIRIGI